MVETVHVMSMTTSSQTDSHISDDDLALVRSTAAASVNEAPPLPLDVAERIAAYLIEPPRVIRDAS